MQEQIDKIIQWGNEAGIIGTYNLASQANKIAEEICELERAFLSRDFANLTEEIGDVFIATIIFIAMLKKRAFPENKINQPNSSSKYCLRLLYEYHYFIHEDRDTFESATHLIEALACFAENVGFELKKCVSISYEKIMARKRKG